MVLADELLALNWVATKVQAWHEDGGCAIPTWCKLNYVKLNQIGSNGKYKKSYSNTYTFSTPVNGGGSSTVAFPLQTAMTVSLRTSQRGPRFRGRFYMPAPSQPLSTADYRFSSGYAASVAAAADTLITGINAWTGVSNSPGPVSVVSKFGTAQLVEQVWVGRVPDTQRRRRRSMPEEYEKRPI